MRGSATKSVFLESICNIVPWEKIGVGLGYIGRHKIAYKIPVYFPCDKVTVKHYGGMCYPSKKMWRS